MKQLFILTILVLAALLPAGGADTLQGHIYYQNIEGRIGVLINTNGVVDYVHPDSPADKAGIQAKDVVIKVDGRERNLRDITGQPGTIVVLNVRRDSHPEGPLVFVIERIDYRMIKR